MREYGAQPALVRDRSYIEPSSEDRRTLGEHYEVIRQRYRIPERRNEDAVLRRIFAPVPGRQRQRAAALLRRLRAHLRSHIAERAGCSEYLAHQVVRGHQGTLVHVGGDGTVTFEARIPLRRAPDPASPS